jgi:hypothetical protein
VVKVLVIVAVTVETAITAVPLTPKLTNSISIPGLLKLGLNLRGESAFFLFPQFFYPTDPPN